MLSDLKNQLMTAIENSLRQLPLNSFPMPAITLEIPENKMHGEFACNVALRLAGPLKQNPMEVGKKIQQNLQKEISAGSLQQKIQLVDLKPPGFINFFLSAAALGETVTQIRREAERYGRQRFGNAKKIQIEFVSANPTGPLSVAHARQAAVGDALANILDWLGFRVTKEFYVNDEGNQINILGRSIRDRAREIVGESFSFPEDNYQGEYIKDMAGDFLARHEVRDRAGLDRIAPEFFFQYGCEELLNVIKQELENFGVHFDVWSFQSKIATADHIEKVLGDLRQKGSLYDQDGALWFRSTQFGDDKDRVVKKSDGTYTYLAPDIVYHQNKFERGFEQVINLWGPDHHGYIPRLKAAVQALGYHSKNLVVLIVQLATIFRDGKPLSMSTRRGQYISLREVMEEVGVDAARFFFLMRHLKAPLEFDLELAKKQTPENPVYYVQYAHARINSVLQLAASQGLQPSREDLQHLSQPEELNLTRELAQFPEILLTCGHQLDPYSLVDYLERLATGFHKFYDTHRVVSEDRTLSSERLALIDATRIVLANGLKILGVSAPVRM